MIQHLKVVHGTPAAFSWEAWGESPDRFLLDPIYSVGNSTSATAAWIAKSQALGSSANVSNSMNYLRLASSATGLEIPGVVPFAWPIDRFEQSFSLYALAVGGLLPHPALEDVVNHQVHNLYEAMTPYGMPFTDHFIPDLDDTAASIIVFRTYGKVVRPEVLSLFKNGSGYFTYPGEFHASTSAHARAVQALGFLDEEEAFQAQQVLLPFQNPDGVWPGDKWHKSWLYTTSHMLYTLHTSPGLPAVEKGLNKLVDGQNEDGGWGIGLHSTTAETAYVMLALQFYRKQNPFLEWVYRRGQAWLLENIYRKPVPGENLWIGKELFKPHRIDRAFELTALLQAFLEP
jgi:halimadienyl-diphosphate synthase